MAGDTRARTPTAAERRARCLWLAQLASYRSGVIARLVDVLGSIEAAVSCAEADIRRALTLSRRGKLGVRGESGGDEDGHQPRLVLEGEVAPRRRHENKRGRGRDAAPVERMTDEAQFAALLAAGDQAIDEATLSESVVTWCDELYPPALRGLYDPPPALFVGGCCAPASLAILHERPVVAVVGSRSPSPYGAEMTAALARDLARAGAIVVSGMALGLDATAHAAAVAEAEGVLTPATVGVLGCGVDVVYPRSNEWLFAAVRRCGLLVSEFWFGVPARAWRFPARNRVIAGLAAAVVIVEGSERSGSLITADYALEIGRDVFAVPGEAGRRLSAGPHKLLRQGAALCESAGDVLAALGVGMSGTLGRQVGAAPNAAAPTRTGLLAGAAGRVAEAIVAELDGAERTIDELAARTGSPSAEVAAVVSALEVEGIVSVGAGRCRLRRGSSP